MTSEQRSVFVWNWLPGEASAVVCGRLDVTTDLNSASSASSGTFVYGKSYLNNPCALPIDPVAIPLVEKVFTFTALGGIPSAILDAVPDTWGRKVIDILHGAALAHPLDYALLANDATGSLGFSRDGKAPPAEGARAPVPIETFLTIAEAIEQNRPLANLGAMDDTLRLALQAGTGGARPKASVIRDGHRWIAKFTSSADKFAISNPRLEHITLELARRCGINAVESELLTVGGKDVLLVRRFDRVNAVDTGIDSAATYKRAVLSARTVFHSDPGLQQYSFSGSYGRLARQLGTYIVRPRADTEELFRRLCFNVAVANIDDHELNHALVYNERVRGYQLAPAYDIVPSLADTQRTFHALQIGGGFEGIRQNVLDAAVAFDISQADAGRTFDQTIDEIAVNWKSVARATGLKERECAPLERLFSKVAISARVNLDAAPQTDLLPPVARRARRPSR